MELNQITELLEATLKDGGCTVETESFKPSAETDGYFVGGVIPETVVKVSSTVTKPFMEAISAALDAGIKYLGTWVHEDDIYVDGSEWFATLEEATKRGRERGELAIWDNLNGQEITL